MQIACPQCQANYNVDEARIPTQGVQIKCPRCQHTFVVPSPSSPGAVPLPGQGGAVPLPGQGGAVPLPGQGGAVPLPGQGGAVPLPGQGRSPGAVPLPGAGAVPLPGQGGAVPLPGQGGAVPLPGQGRGAVPLPGQGGAVPLPGQGAAPRGSLPSMEEIFGTSSPSIPAPAPPATAPPGQSMSIGDIFGDDGNNPAEESNRSPHPFHGNNSVMVDAGREVLDFINDAGSPSAPPREESFQIRKRSGRVLGPLSTTEVLTMFHKGDLLGSEEASTDGVTWRPLAQIPAFAQTIQQAMANALSGLDDLPVPKGSGFDNLPAPKGAGYDDLPVPRDSNMDLPVPKGPGGVDALGVDTGQLRDAEKAKALVERKRQRKERTALRAASVAVIVLLFLAAGIGINFIKPDVGYFGYKLVYHPKGAALPPKPTELEPPPPPVALPAVDVDTEELIAADTYIAYRQGAEQAQRAVEAGKAVKPFPDSAKKAAAQHARFLAYLVLVDDLPAFVPKLRESLALADGDEVAKAVGTAASSYVDKQWDKGIGALKPLTDDKKKLTPERRAEVWTWIGIGDRGKADLDAAVSDFDKALQATTSKKLALYLQAQTLVDASQPAPALEYVDKVLSLDPTHPRANILKGTLLADDFKTLDEGKKILVAITEGDKGKDASPPELAQAWIGRANVAIVGQKYPDALRYVQKAVELVPLNRTVRVRAAEMALRLRDYKVAQANGEKLLEANPEDIDGLIMVSRARMGNRDALGAYSDLQVAVKKHPNNALLNYWFGVAAREMSKLDEARSQFEKAAKLDPKHADPIIDIVYDLIEQGKLTEAVKRAGDAEDKVFVGERYKVRAAKAFAYARRRQFEQAEKEYVAVLKESPRDTDTRARHATMLIAQRHLDDAAAEIKRAEELDAKNPAVIVAAGDLLAARGDNKGAMTRYEEAMQLAPNNYMPYLHAARTAVALKDLGRAKGFVDTAQQLRPSVAEVLAMQAIVTKSMDPKAASRTMEQAIDQAPEEPVYPYELGLIFSGMVAYPEAIDAFKKAVSLDPDYVDAYYQLAKVQRELNRIKDAKQSLENAVRIDPKRTDCWLELAAIYQQQGDEAGSLRAYERALKADPKNPASVCQMGETLVVMLGNDNKQLKRGIDALERCVRLAPKHESAWKNLGNAYKTLGKKKDAVRCYERHLAVNPDDPDNGDVKQSLADMR